MKDIRRRTRKHHPAEKKIRIILEGLRGEDGIAELCRREGIATSLCYSWSKEFLEAGKKRLTGDTTRQATSPEVKELRHEAAALKETDFIYLKVVGWGWFYVSTILDDYSRYVTAWRLCTTMKASDVTATLEDALVASGCGQVTVAHRPRLLSDNGASCISGELADWLEAQGMDHTRGAPRHPQTQGKIERWHQTLKNRLLLENYHLPGALEEAVADVIDPCNHHRHHESLRNFAPADVYLGRAETILQRRKEIKRKTIENRRLLHRQNAA